MRASTRRIGRGEADRLYQKQFKQTKISAPKTDCIAPIGEDLLLKGLHQVVPGEFYAAATRPPSVYRGNPFQIEVATCLWWHNRRAAHYARNIGGTNPTETDLRTLRQFLIHTFDGTRQ